VDCFVRSWVIRYCSVLFSGLLFILSLDISSAEVPFYNAYEINADLLLAEIVEVSNSRAKLFEIRGLRKRKARALGVSDGFVFGVHDLKEGSFAKLGTVNGNVDSFVVKRSEGSGSVWFSVLNDGIPSVYRLDDGKMIFDDKRSDAAENLKDVDLFLSNGQLGIGVERLSSSSVVSVYGFEKGRREEVGLKDVYVHDIWNTRKGEIYLVGVILTSGAEDSELWIGKLKHGEKYTVEEVSRAHIKGSVFGFLKFLPTYSDRPVLRFMVRGKGDNLSVRVFRLSDQRRFVQMIEKSIGKLERNRMIGMADVCHPYLFNAEATGEDLEFSFYDYEAGRDKSKRVFRLPAKVISRVGAFIGEGMLAVAVSYSKFEEKRRSDGWYNWDGYAVYFVEDNPCYFGG